MTAASPLLPAADPNSRSTKRVRAMQPAVWIEAPAFQRVLGLVLFMVSMTIIALLANLVFVSQVQHYTSQKALYAQLRLSLAEGSAPIAPINARGDLVTPGTPIAVMVAPVIGVASEVIVEGTASSQTSQGIGHRRDTALPCQVGSSVLMARSGAYGGIGQAFKSLTIGSKFSITMGQGGCTYQVTGSRNPGDAAPSAPSGKGGNLTLTTAAGTPYLPTEVYRVDAKLVTDGFDRSAVALPTGALPSSEAAMGTDTSNLFALVLLLELLVGVAIATTWLWKRWGRWQAWIVAAPPLLAISLLCATAVTQWLLPNLI